MSDSVGAQTTASELYSERAQTYLRFIRSVGYPQGLRAIFMGSSVLSSDLRVLDAGCGTGVTTLALRSALAARGMPARRIDAFDLTPAMLGRFRSTLAASGIEDVELARADVLALETLPREWSNYDLVVTASMLEYVPRESFPVALRGLRGRLREGGKLLLFITRNNALMRPLIGRWWEANLYTRAEIRVALKEAGFIDTSFGRFPFPYRHLDLWGHAVSARAAPSRSAI
ncbi:MAG: class I SAM-dependent methyltransferase [Myxococcota bacterium]